MQLYIPFQGASNRTFQLRKGFSRVEFSIVLAVISILAAIWFPAFDLARENARQSSCISNLQQIGIGWKQYAQDYDQKTMRFSTAQPGKIFYWWGSFDGTTLNTSEGLLRPYLKSAQVQNCPAFQNNSRVAIGATGYAYNNRYLSPSSYGPAPTYTEIPRVVDLAQIQSPAETVVMADSARISIVAGAPRLESNTYLGAPSSAYPSLHGRHNGTASVLWADGHVNIAQPVYRSGRFGSLPFQSADFKKESLGDLDRDGNLATNELFDLK